MRYVPSHLILVLTIFIAPLTYADEQRIQFYKCYGNNVKLTIEGRVIEQSSSTSASPSDSTFKNIIRKVKQLFNDEQANTAIELSVDNIVSPIESDDEGYFSLELATPSLMKAGYHNLTGRVENGRIDTCKLLVIPVENTVGVISDFDDTVIVSDVTDKDKLLVNSFAKNYTQRKVVSGTPQFLQALVSENINPAYPPLFFVSGSPRQIQESIDKFLDLHGFPPRIIITKKISGDGRDPLFDQFEYKTEKINALLKFFPDMKFYLLGDDGEKDPEVYNAIAEKFPDRILATWIHHVNPDPARVRFPNQILFERDPHK